VKSLQVSSTPDFWRIGVREDCARVFETRFENVEFHGLPEHPTPHGLGVRIPALQLFLRAQSEDQPDLARLASPVFHAEAEDPPLLILHGDQDPQVPINQSHELHAAFKTGGLSEHVSLDVVQGSAHGGKAFYLQGPPALPAPSSEARKPMIGHSPNIEKEE